jgi:DNA adenine methylase
VKPILKYPGAKWRLAPWIISYLPKHKSYLEPFFGSGAVFFNKDKARVETINDIDDEVVNFFRVCREQPDALADALALTPWARAEREAAFSATDDPREKARRFATRCWMTFGAHRRQTNGWRHTTGKNKDGGPDNPRLWSRLPECVREASARLMEAQIESRPAIEVIERHNGPEVLIYADPPYPHGTRTAHGKAYDHEMADADHIELLRVLSAHKGMVVLSGYDNELYREALQGWADFSASTTAERGAIRTETLWLNPAAAETLRKTREGAR